MYHYIIGYYRNKYKEHLTNLNKDNVEIELLRKIYFQLRIISFAIGGIGILLFIIWFAISSLG